MNRRSGHGTKLRSTRKNNHVAAPLPYRPPRVRTGRRHHSLIVTGRNDVKAVTPVRYTSQAPPAPMRRRPLLRRTIGDERLHRSERVDKREAACSPRWLLRKKLTHSPPARRGSAGELDKNMWLKNRSQLEAQMNVRPPQSTRKLPSRIYRLLLAVALCAFLLGIAAGVFLR